MKAVALLSLISVLFAAIYSSHAQDTILKGTETIELVADLEKGPGAKGIHTMAGMLCS